MLVCAERFTENFTRTFFDRNWQRMPVRWQDYPSSKEQIEKPKNFEEMIAFAEALSKDIPQARIDFYEVKGKTYFGEITFYSEAGYGKFTPEEWDRTLGDWLELPAKR